jgi:hypothetical protein
MLFTLPSYQFPYVVMNRCLYLNPKTTGGGQWTGEGKGREGKGREVSGWWFTLLVVRYVCQS